MPKKRFWFMFNGEPNQINLRNKKRVLAYKK